jgi:hypothetical protein
MGALGGAFGAFQAQKRHGKEGGRAAAVAAAAMAALGEITTRVIDGFGRLAATMTSASTDPSRIMEDFSGTIRAAGRALMAIFPPAGIVVGAFGALGQATAKVMQSFDGLVQRYEQFSGGIASTVALTEAVQTIKDIQRAQEATPALMQYVIQRGQLQQKIEDTKIEFMKTIMPLALSMMQIFQDVVLPILKVVADGLNVLIGIFKGKKIDLSDIESMMRDMKDVVEMTKETDLAEALTRGFVDPRSPRGRSEDYKNDPFVRLPIERGRQQGR